MVAENELLPLRADALRIFTEALSGCSIENAFARHLSLEGAILRRHRSPMLPPLEESLKDIRKVQVIAFGKAAESMLNALYTRLPSKLRVSGVCSSPDEPRVRHKHIRYYTGGHPLPNEDSVAAAQAVLDLLRRADEDTYVFFLVSGGGSSLLELPRDRTIPLEDVRAFYETLILSGAAIAEINVVRKFFSAVKGGRLAQAASAARKLTLLLADVPMKDLGVVASSPTLPDHSTWAECEALLEEWKLLPRLPATVRTYFDALRREPPALPVPAAALGHTEVDVLLSNHDLVNAARDSARALGYKVVIDNTCDNWPFDQASVYLLKRFAALRAEWGKVCLLSSGEVTVALEPGRPGCGGRNQHFALDAALRIDGMDEKVVILSAGSDGIDGNSAAAGAVADPSTACRARRFAFVPEQSLAHFASCPLFTALGDAVMTGPTGNNLRDLRILLADRS